MENLLKNRTDLKRERLERTRSFMDKALPDALVEKDRYEDLIKSLSLPDKNDRHVLALAIATQSQLIVTFNIKDFPDSALSKYQIQAIHRDQFVHNLRRLVTSRRRRLCKKTAISFKKPYHSHL